MLSAARARRLGRDLRLRLDPDLSLSAQGLIDTLKVHLGTRGVEVVSSAPRRLKGRSACIMPGLLSYDRTLEGDPRKLLRVLAHEVGHALQHSRVHGLVDLVDPAQVMTPAAGQRGLAEARYSPVSRDEFQAEAFAVEFVCPSEDALAVWLADGEATSRSVAARFHTSVGVARAQLGEALYGRVFGPERADDGGGASQAGAEPRESLRPDDRQNEAIHHRGSAALVDAGPGCGKTHTLVERIAWLLDEAAREAAPGLAGGAGSEARVRREAAARTLVLTFSTEAAGELESRIAARLAPELAQEVHVATFHGFGRQLLAEYGEGLGIGAKAPVLDEAAQTELMVAALAVPGAEAIVDLKDPDATARDAVRHVQHLKQSLTPDPDTGELRPWTPALFRRRLDDLEADAAADPEVLMSARAFARVFSAYEEAKASQGAADFADLVALSIAVLRDAPGVAENYRRRYRDVLVDEYQDVSRSVSLFLELLCGSEGEPWVVGDPNQAIFRFLNADPENLARFPEAFAGAAVYELESNYRSAPEIVGVANALAALLRHPDETVPDEPPRFVAVGSETAEPALPDDPAPVVVATADSDAAERGGAAQVVEEWIDRGVPPHEIAVLARRNVDVRKIALALGDRGVRTAVGAVMTPDGTAGDLAAVVTFADGRAGLRSSLPRVAHALSQGRHPSELVDEAVAWVLEWVPRESDDLDAFFGSLEPPAHVRDLVREVGRAYTVLRRERYVGDPFSMMAAFLFDGSDYTRRLLDAGDAESAAAAALALRRAEASSSLARAAAYRHAHPPGDVDERPATARTARLDFGAEFRRALATGLPSPVPPPRVEGAVQVMTCHASKGLEFPYVCVVGQTLSPLSSRYGWLPDALQPDEDQDAEQADALFFVAATRAQRALVVSYAERTNAGRGRYRTVTGLLRRWAESGSVRQVRWEESGAETGEPEPHGAVWGRTESPRLSPYHLAPKTCSVSTYIEEVARLRFPESTPPLYPLYVDRLREVIRVLVRAAHERGGEVSGDVVRAVFARTWRTVATLHEGHPHLDLYGRLALRAALAFARAYSRPFASAHRPGELDAIEADLHPEWRVRAGILVAFLDDDGLPTAIVLRTESYAAKAAKRGGALKWSDLGSPQRQIPLALFHEHWAGRAESVHVHVYSSADGALYAVDWSTRKTKGQTSMERIRDEVRGRIEGLTSGPYAPAPSSWSCPRCRSRILCPHYRNHSN